MGHTHFWNNKILYMFFDSLRGVILYFYSCNKTPQMSTRKAEIEVCGESPYQVFTSEKNPTLQPKFINAELY